MDKLQKEPQRSEPNLVRQFLKIACICFSIGFIVTVLYLNNVSPTPSRTPVVNVVSHKAWWSPDTNSKVIATVSNNGKEQDSSETNKPEQNISEYPENTGEDRVDSPPKMEQIDMEHTPLTHSDYFPTRNRKKLAKILSAVNEFMEPSLQKIEIVRKYLLSQNYEWEQPKPTNVMVVKADDPDYFSKISYDAKPNGYKLLTTIPRGTGMVDKLLENSMSSNIQSILVKAPYGQVLKLFPGDYSSDYSSNDCKHMEDHSIYGKKSGDPMSKAAGVRFFNASCRNDINAAWKTKPFQEVALEMGLPEKSEYRIGSDVILTYINVLRNGVVDSNGDVVSGNVKIVIRRCSMKTSPKVPSAKNNYDEVFSISQFWGVGFFHATVEDEIRIAPYVEFLKRYPNIKIHVNTAASFVKKFLGQIGIESNRLVTGPVGAKILYVPAGTTCGRPNIFNAALFSLRLRASINFEPQPRKSIVIIKRTKSRHFRQHNAIVAKLEKLVSEEYSNSSFKLEIYPDNPLPGLNKTLAMFNRAFIVIAPHGAGESNLFLSEHGTVMIEGLCTSAKKLNLCYRNLGAVLGHRYFGIAPKGYSCYDTRPEHIEKPLRKILDYFT